MTPAGPTDFGVLFRLWRLRRGLNQRQLAALMSYDSSYISHIECGRHVPTQAVVLRAEAVLRTGGAIVEAAVADGAALRERVSPAKALSILGVGAVVDQEIASLHLSREWVHCSVARTIRNVGTEPINRYTAYVDVDRDPVNASASAAYYSSDPITWDELRFHAEIDTAPGEPLDFQVVHDRDAYKQIAVRFETGGARFPIYPGRSAVVTHSYRVRAQKWGPYFRRDIRTPTEELRVIIRFDIEANRVRGSVTSLNSEEPEEIVPALARRAGNLTLRWAGSAPSLQSVYEFRW
ncbi:MAG TPA: helix-turn-helix transcriptional regulator [Actinoplanes sp.]|nr:helix-turn-helix transcriptional regulator [Actinoplanes sp.]